jgi:hypothetical protein
MPSSDGQGIAQAVFETRVDLNRRILPGGHVFSGSFVPESLERRDSKQGAVSSEQMLPTCTAIDSSNWKSLRWKQLMNALVYCFALLSAGCQMWPLLTLFR